MVFRWDLFRHRELATESLLSAVRRGRPPGASLVKPNPQILNGILAGLSRDAYARLTPHLQHVNLPVGMLLTEPNGTLRYAYFVNSGMVSVVAALANGNSLEVGVIGREGMADVSILLGCETSLNRIIVQVTGTGMRMKAATLNRLYNDSNSSLRASGNRYIHYRLNQVSQSAICNHAHQIEERLARWLLSTADAVGEDRFDLTHEFLSQMLGARRSSVTLVAGVLAESGMIEYRRGRIKILKRPQLQELACECYGLLKAEASHLSRN